MRFLRERLRRSTARAWPRAAAKSRATSAASARSTRRRRASDRLVVALLRQPGVEGVAEARTHRAPTALTRLHRRGRDRRRRRADGVARRRPAGCRRRDATGTGVGEAPRGPRIDAAIGPQQLCERSARESSPSIASQASSAASRAPERNPQVAIGDAHGRLASQAEVRVLGMVGHRAANDDALFAAAAPKPAATASQRSSRVGRRAAPRWSLRCTTRAPVEHDRALGDRQDQARVLLDDDGRQALVAHDARDRAQQLLDDDRRQALERLVEQQQLAGSAPARAPTASICCSPPESWLPRLRGARPGAGTSRRRAAGVHGPGRATAVRFSSTVSDLKMLRSCGTQPMPAAARRCGGSAVTSLPGEHDAAGMAARHADQRVDQRRLAGAVAAEQRERLAGVEREVEPWSTTASP